MNELLQELEALVKVYMWVRGQREPELFSEDGLEHAIEYFCQRIDSSTDYESPELAIVDYLIGEEPLASDIQECELIVAKDIDLFLKDFNTDEVSILLALPKAPHDFRACVKCYNHNEMAEYLTNGQFKEPFVQQKVKYYSNPGWLSFLPSVEEDICFLISNNPLLGLEAIGYFCKFENV